MAFSTPSVPGYIHCIDTARVIQFHVPASYQRGASSSPREQWPGMGYAGVTEDDFIFLPQQGQSQFGGYTASMTVWMTEELNGAGSLEVLVNEIESWTIRNEDTSPKMVNVFIGSSLVCSGPLLSVEATFHAPFSATGNAAFVELNLSLKKGKSFAEENRPQT